MSRCQWASGPSPRHETMPMPVMTASRASAMARDLERERELVRPGMHVRAELLVRERHGAESDLGFAHRLAVAGEPRLGHREARALVHQARFAIEPLPRRNETAQLEPVGADEDRPPLEFGKADHQP